MPKKVATKAKVAKKTTPKKKAAPRKKSAAAAEEAWDGLRESIGTEDVVSYNMKSAFAANMAVNHPKFGLGLVVEAMEHKIKVVFKDGERDLVHNRKN